MLTAIADFQFAAWPKIARLNRDMIITEKLDGTNAAIVVSQDPDGRYAIGAQSRTRAITPEDDNYGFARWVYENADELAPALGPGYHFGEYWGGGIQRGYGLAKDDKRFSLFNVARYADINSPLLSLVPVLYEGPFCTTAVDTQVQRLRTMGSVAVPGFMNPEGVIVFHVAANHLFKVTCKKDEAPKGEHVPC